jgi:hypothetical protein
MPTATYGPTGACCAPAACPETSEDAPLVIGDKGGSVLHVAALISSQFMDRWCVAWISGKDAEPLIASGLFAEYKEEAEDADSA